MQKNIFDPSSTYFFPLRILILIILGLVIYYQTFSYGFFFDDKMFIINNPYIRNFNDIHHMWLSWPKTRLIGTYSFALNYALGKLNPFGYHLFNVIIHLLTSLLTWFLIRTLFKITKFLAKDIKTQEELAFLTALIFLAHPCQTQAVTYISQRFESMATLIYIGAVTSYLKARLSPIGQKKYMFFACAFGLGLIGLYTKETTTTLPIMFFAAEFILFAQKSRNFSSRQINLIIVGLIILFIVIMETLLKTNVLTEFIQFKAPSQSYDGDTITSFNYILTQMRVFLTFMRLLILPINQNLDYDYPLSTDLYHPPLTFIGFCVILSLIFLVFKIRRNKPLISFGIAWILITFSINLAPRIFVIFEHKLYLISLGFFIIFTAALSQIIKNKKILYTIILIIISLLTLMSYQRNEVWKNQLTLWEDIVKKSPHKSRAYETRGLAYFEKGRLEEAIADNQMAIKIKPINAPAYNNLGVIYATLKNFSLSLFFFNKAIAIDPQYADAYFNRANLWRTLKNQQQAFADYSQAIKLNPDYKDAYYNRGIIYDKDGNWTQAINDFNTAIRINPQEADIYYCRGVSYAKLKKYSYAIKDYTQAISLQPNYPEAFNNRGFIYAIQGYFKLALYDFNKAIKLQPTYLEAINNRLMCLKYLTINTAITSQNKIQAM